MENHIECLRQACLNKDIPFQLFDDADAVSSFIKLIEYKLKHSRSMMTPLIAELMPSIIYICDNQTKFNASIDIYGDFKEKIKAIREIINCSRPTL